MYFMVQNDEFSTFYVPKKREKEKHPKSSLENFQLKHQARAKAV